MNTRTLGKTGLQVSELGLGGLFVSSHGAEFEQGRAAVHRALQLGVNLIDTAPTYANSEEVLGRVLEDVTQPFIISTKLGGRPTPFLPQDKACLMQSVEESLRLLKRDHIDLLMIHEPDRPGEYDWWTDRENYSGPVLEVLDELKAQGVIRFTGLGGTTPYEMANVIESGRFDVVLTAFNYSLLWREAEHYVLPAAKKHNMGIIVGSPLQQGALARRYDDEIENGARWMSPPRRAQYRKLYQLLDEIDIPLAELGLRFVLSNPNVSSVLMGARSAEEVEQNVAATARGPLPAELLKRLDEIAAMVPFRPFDEPAGLPFNWDYRGPGPMR
jgi:aryl-alcohol dehydrogenase-like predicted oxidoreductase